MPKDSYGEICTYFVLEKVVCICQEKFNSKCRE